MRESSEGDKPSGLGCVAVIILAVAALGSAIIWYTGLPKMGAIEKLQSTDAAGLVRVPVDINTAKEEQTFQSVHDDIGLNDLVAKERLILVPTGTKVRVLDRSWLPLLYRIRMIEGPFAGKAGWVSKKILQKSPIPPEAVDVYEVHVSLTPGSAAQKVTGRIVNKSNQRLSNIVLETEIKDCNGKECVSISNGTTSLELAVAPGQAAEVSGTVKFLSPLPEKPKGKLTWSCNVAFAD